MVERDLQALVLLPQILANLKNLQTTLEKLIFKVDAGSPPEVSITNVRVVQWQTQVSAVEKMLAPKKAPKADFELWQVHTSSSGTVTLKLVAKG